MRGRRILILCLVLWALVGVLPAWAEDAIPSRVGRVSAVDGDAAIRQAGGDWRAAGINDPIAAGMSVRTGAQGRAMLRIGPQIIALANGTEIDLAQLDAGAVRIALRQGRLGVHLTPLDATSSAAIDIPCGVLTLLAPGDYDIAAGDASAPARIAVLAGTARFAGKGLDTAVATGAAAVLSGSDPVVASREAAAPDDFAAWWRPAGTATADLAALHYISSEMTGYEALDDGGSWETVEGYGAVWFPKSVPDNWAPYRFGHWRWVAPWGWTWIDDMPWGFAPSHYGRWAMLPGPDAAAERWGWVPGRRIADPVYAPAVVAFLGTPRIGISYPDAFGPAVAWFPLAPGEVYWPSYTGDPAAIRQVNIGAVDDVSEIGPPVDGAPPDDVVNAEYRNRRFASVVPRPVFVGGRPVAPALVQLPRRRLDDAPLLAGSPHIPSPAPRPVAVASAVASAAAPAKPAPVARPAAHPKSLVRRVHGNAHPARDAGKHARLRSAQRTPPAASTRAAHRHLRLAAAHRRP